MMYARGVDPEIRVDNDPVERGDRTARMETRASWSEAVFIAQIREATRRDTPFIGVAHDHCRHGSRPRPDMVEDRAHLTPSPQAAEVEVHADDAQILTANAEFGEDRPARFEHRQVEHREILDFAVLDLPMFRVSSLSSRSA